MISRGAGHFVRESSEISSRLLSQQSYVWVQFPKTDSVRVFENVRTFEKCVMDPLPNPIAEQTYVEPTWYNVEAFGK